MTKAEKIRSYRPSRKSNKIRTGATTTSTQKVRTGAIRTGNQKLRSGAKPKSTGITQSVGEVIRSNYSVGAPQMIAPVETGSNNDGGMDDKIGNVGFRSILKNPVYLVLVVVVLGSLVFAFKK
jgi:hypothetical protein